MKLILSSSPHAHAKNSVSSMMRDVIIALLPAAGCSVWFFGMRAVWLIAVCIAASVVTEAACRILMKRENSIGDFSAVLPGLLLALNLPPDLPLWMAVTGSVFAIAVAKQVFGGLGYNPFNPALSARAFMLISFTGAMTTWSNPVGYESVTGATSVDAMTCATPLVFIKKGDVSQLTSLKSFLLGNIGGCIGETCAIALLIGAAYLMIRKVITWHIPVSYLASMFVFALYKGGVRDAFEDLPEDCEELDKLIGLAKRLIAAGFAQRRKTLTNALSSVCPKENIVAALEHLGIRTDIRGEKLSAKDFVNIAKFLRRKE